MSQLSPTQRGMIWAILAVVVLGILVAFIREQHEGAHQTNGLPVYGQVSDFRLTNNLGQSVSLNDYLGKVWLADIIFTRCPGPCARMTSKLREIQSVLPVRDDLKLISITTDPSHDTPDVLDRYAKRYEAESSRWHFLTGVKRDILALAVDQLKLTALEKDSDVRETPDDLFIHSTNLVLIDRQGRLRASFVLLGYDSPDGPAQDGSDQWTATRQAILAAVDQLLRE